MKYDDYEAVELARVGPDSLHFVVTGKQITKTGVADWTGMEIAEVAVTSLPDEKFLISLQLEPGAHD